MDQTKSGSRNPHEDYTNEAHDVARYRGESGLGSGPVRERLVAGLLLAGPDRAKPEGETRGHPQVGPPPAGGTMKDRCKEDWAADEGGNLGGPIPSWPRSDSGKLSDTSGGGSSASPTLFTVGVGGC
ncbi:hypothetical protein ILYODFUR_017421 [Ilyodon furcidens]|uniref:Uncharacterized protein n=1 Tax=Ilyodon furcidens TaxID=33524 RepID=A0ABV0VHS9_9TELE